MSAIFVLLATLKRKEFTPNTIAQLARLIDQNMLLALELGAERKLAIYHTKLIQTDWMPAEDSAIALKGLDLDAVWENLIVQVGGITIRQGNTLDKQIAADERRAKLEKEIARLEKLARAEKQPRKKFALVQEINMLKEGGSL